MGFTSVGTDLELQGSYFKPSKHLKGKTFHPTHDQREVQASLPSILFQDPLNMLTIDFFIYLVNSTFIAYFYMFCSVSDNANWMAS